MDVRAADLSHDEIEGLIGRNNPVILEIGSNDGADTLEFLRRYPRGRVLCFDCEPRAIALWRERVHDPRATLAEIALDETAGVKTFHQSGGAPPGHPPDTDWHMSGSLLPPTGHLDYSTWCTFDRTIEVRTERLDDWMRANATSVERVDFLWIDVQGAERRVFAGGPLTLARTRYVKAEAHIGELYQGQPTEDEMKAFFAGLGFECRGRYADDLLFERRP